MAILTLLLLEPNCKTTMSENKPNNARKNTLYLIVIVLVIASVVFRIINKWNFETTSILFVGLPALMALLLIRYSKTPKTAYGLVFFVVTLFLLLSAILLGEGIVCVIFMAPIFYGVAAIIAFIFEYFKKKGKSNLSAIIIFPLILLLAQPLEIQKEPEIQNVETNIVLNKIADLDSFSQEPDFLKNYPSFFKIGFPKPIGIIGKGLNVGDIRNIQFESKTKGIGTLSLEIIEKDQSSIVFKPISDDTHINHWLTWNRIEVDIVEKNENQTEIKWTTYYQCDLGPSWYFEPFEEIAVDVMNKHLIHAYFN